MEAPERDELRRLFQGPAFKKHAGRLLPRRAPDDDATGRAASALEPDEPDPIERIRLDAAARTSFDAVTREDDPEGRQEPHGSDPAEDRQQLLAALEGWRLSPSHPAGRGLWCLRVPVRQRPSSS